jgi:AAA domain
VLDITPAFSPTPLHHLGQNSAPIQTDWLWNGYLARQNITLLTSQWKTGKTTLVAGLIQTMANDGTFLGRSCRAGKVLVVSEEADFHWAARQRFFSFGGHAQLMCRPFRARPTPEEWQQVCTFAEDRAIQGELDLLVVDPLVMFVPGNSESDPGTLMNFLQPLRNLAGAGVAVLVLHHPRKAKSAEGSTARGSGLLTGFVDVVLELRRVARTSSDSNERRLSGVSRWPDTPAELYFEWIVGTPEFRVVDDPDLLRFQENWSMVKEILSGRDSLTSHRELLADWPADREAPSRSLLYQWLTRATDLGWVVREGDGTRWHPYAFGLPEQAL